MKINTIGPGFVQQHLNYLCLEQKIPVNSNDIGKFLDYHKPDVLINCIGKTGRPNIDWCESNQEITSLINTQFPILLAEECLKRSIHLIHIGSGCIFSGPSPHIKNGIDYGWKETDIANPQSFYSKTKYDCDLQLQNMKNVSILRIRMPISDRNHPRNLINKLQQYSQIINIPNSVTFMSDLSRCIDWIIKNSHVGIFHVTNPGPLNAAQIMKEYQKYIPSHSFEIINESQLDQLTLAKRSNCILNTDRINNLCFYLNSSETALMECMKNYIQNL